jgi:predicted TIM-barrel fold metal-dependent hydrolase
MDIMGRTYNVIDSDGHVLEPRTFWQDYIDPNFRDRAPKLIIDDKGKDRFLVEGKLLGPPAGLGLIGAIGVRECINGKWHHATNVPISMEYTQGRKGGFDPHARIPDMDLDGIDAAFLYPSLGLFAGAIQDPPLAAAASRAYNRWLAEYCRPYPERLFGVAMLPMQSIELTIEEMRYARNELGMRAGFLRPNPYNNRMLGDPQYDVFWAEAQELDFSIGIHEGTGGMPAVGVDRFESFGARHMVSHTMEMMLAALSIIWGGVCERFPKVRIGFLESGGGWMAPWLDRMDRHFEDKALFNDSPLTVPPSEYFKRQCWISYEPVEGNLTYLVDYVGPHKILWATDYPHPDGFFPGAPAQIAEKLPENQRRTVLAESAMQFYNLQ